jgi:hypothetical protein
VAAPNPDIPKLNIEDSINLLAADSEISGDKKT